MAIRSIWPSNPNPLNTSADGASAAQWVSGLRFRTTQPGKILGIRWYGVSATGKTINLYTNSGSLLATSATGNATSGSWTSSLFTTPIDIQACTTYVATVYSPGGSLAYTSGGLASKVENGPLIALADKFDGINAVYAANAGNVFPTADITLSYNMFVDVLFEDSLPAPLVVNMAPGMMASGPPGNVWVTPIVRGDSGPQPVPLISVPTDPNATLFLPPPDTGTNPGGWPSNWIFVPGAAYTATNWPVTIQASVSQSASTLRATARSVAAAQASGVSLVRAATNSILSTLSTVPSSSEAIAKTVSVTASPAATVQRTGTKSALTSVATSVSQSRAVAKTITISQAVNLSVKRAATKAISMTQASSIVALKTGTRTVTGTQGHSGSLVRTVEKIVLAPVVLSNTVRRAVTKTVTGTQTEIASVVRAAGKALLGTQAASSTFLRNAGKVVTSVQASAVSVRKAATKALSLTQAISGTVTRVATKTATATQAQTSQVKRAGAKVLTTAQSATSSFTKTTNRVVEVLAQVSPVISLRRATTKAISVALGAVVTLRRDATKKATATQVSTSVLRRAATKTASSVQASVVTRSFTKAYQVVVFATQGTNVITSIFVIVRLATAAIYRYLPKKAAVVREWDGTKWIVRRVFRKR